MLSRWRGLDRRGLTWDRPLFPGCIANKASGQKAVYWTLSWGWKNKSGVVRGCKHMGTQLPGSEGVTVTELRSWAESLPEAEGFFFFFFWRGAVSLQGGSKMRIHHQQGEQSRGAVPGRQQAPHTRLKLRGSPSSAWPGLGPCPMLLSNCPLKGGLGD